MFFRNVIFLNYLPSLVLPISIVTSFPSLDSSRLNPTKSVLTFLNPKYMIMERRIRENKMDPITTAYITAVSSTGFLIVVDSPFVGVSVGSKNQNKSYINNSNKKINLSKSISKLSKNTENFDQKIFLQIF